MRLFAKAGTTGKKIIYAAGIGLIVWSAILLMTSKEMFQGMERGLLDMFFRFREPEKISMINPYVCSRTKIIAFDETSIGMIGPWPWKRYIHAGFLNKLERFSPETVMIDVLFIDKESVPVYLSERLADDEGLKSRVENIYGGMDKELSATLARYDNVFLDVQLIEQSRHDLPDEYKERIKLTEKRLVEISRPAIVKDDSKVFMSLEPMLPEYVVNAHPGIINAPRDSDGKVRAWPFHYTMIGSDGTPTNLLTVVPAVLLKYFHASINDVTIADDKVIINRAIVPRLDSWSRQPTEETVAFADFEMRVENAKPPAGYRYNTNLYSFMVHQYADEDRKADRVPYFPLNVLDKGGRLRVLDSWEVVDAAKMLGSKKIRLILHDEARYEIPTPAFGQNAAYINFAGQQSKVIEKTQTKESWIYTPVPTESYAAVYFMDDLPDLPEPVSSGKIEMSSDARLKFEQWFLSFCETRGRAVYEQAVEKLGKGVDNRQELYKFINNYPDERKCLLYYDFMSRTNAEPGKLLLLCEEYGKFAAEAGQDRNYFLTEKQMLNCLVDEYRVGFDKYYNKFIFSGGTALGIIGGDIHQTPYAAMAGINVIASAFNTVATGNLMTMTKDTPRLDVVILFVFCLLTAWIYMATNIRIGGGLVLFVMAGAITTAAGFFVAKNVVVTTVPLLLGNLATFMVTLVYKLVTEERNKKFLKKTFGTYLAPELIDRMYKERKMPELGGEARQVTAFFTDIKGFSTFSEILTAHQLVDLLNEYLSDMTGILIEEDGTLDKYIGDAIVAFFGAPVELPDHALRACRTAVRMQRRLDELGRKWEEERHEGVERNIKKLPPEKWVPGHKWPLLVHDMAMRIGINTGEIVVGNMGSTMRMNYTMMGDPVNTAARLESAAKMYGVHVLISESVLNTPVPDPAGGSKPVRDFVEARFIDNVTVVGKSEPVKIFELCAMRGELTESEKQLFDVYGRAIQNYLAMKWDAAIELFQEAARIERFPHEKLNPSLVFIERCQQFKERPPAARAEEWDGVYRLTKKG